VIEVHIGGVQGLIASLADKKPPDAHVWISTMVPASVRSETSLFIGGPMVRIEPILPSFSAAVAAKRWVFASTFWAPCFLVYVRGLDSPQHNDF